MDNVTEIFHFLRVMGLDWSYNAQPRNRFGENEKQPSVIMHEHRMQTPSSPSSSLSSLTSSSSLVLSSAASPSFHPSSLPLSSLSVDSVMSRKQTHITPLSHPAYACHSLEDLRKAIEHFDGCALKQGAKNMVFCDGNPTSDIMLVGEAPGADEDAQGKPFVGMSGQLLDKMMAAIGLDRNVVYISNIIPWRPPGNRPPSTQEIAACLPFIERHIYLKKPKFLLLLGGVATKAILNNNAGIMRLRGQWQTYVPSCADEGFAPIRTLPTFHPAFLLRSPNQKVHAWEDLKTLKAAVDEELASVMCP